MAVGAVVVLGGVLGEGPRPSGTPGAAAATTVASDSPGTSAAPTSAATPAGTMAGETPGPTVPPGSPVAIRISGAKASSKVAANRAPASIFDGTPATAWVSAKGKTEGEWAEVSFAPTAVTRIQLWVGWQRDEPSFYGNNRPHDVTLAFDGGDPVPLELKDVLSPQSVSIPPELGIVAATRVRITISDTWPARKTTYAGSPANDVAISEIKIYGIPATP